MTVVMQRSCADFLQVTTTTTTKLQGQQKREDLGVKGPGEEGGVHQSK